LFAEVKPLSLWGKTKIEIILDKSLHTVADYLEEQILSEKTQVDGKSKALKVLFSLGLLRGSLPNLLSVVNLLRKLNLPVDLVRININFNYFLFSLSDKKFPHYKYAPKHNI
jgi:hypothetical protein